ncbi:MAG: nicotinate mononucleotide-dependent phosphoribosyltransferase CobT [Thermoproteota archaeon]
MLTEGTEKYDLTLASGSQAENFLDRIKGQKPLFICSIGTTETGKIPGISAAGKLPELTDYTPSADVELLLLGECRCIPQVPVTPEGIPTPALITRSALQVSEIPTLILSGGLKVNPQVPFLELGGNPGRNIGTGKAVTDTEEILWRAQIVGKNIADTTDYLVVGESIPGGTTTALGVLLAMGIKAEGKVSSSLPHNPHDLKIKTVKEGLKVSNLEFGTLADDPLKAISCVGDPMMPAFAGLVLGAAEKVPVLMAGGTQMGAILAIVKALNSEVLENLAIGTTRWVLKDETSDLEGIITQIYDVPILAADLDFSKSNFKGLQAYETGIVKEGVGAGGVSIAAMAKTEGSITKDTLLTEIEKNYSQLVESN